MGSLGSAQCVGSYAVSAVCTDWDEGKPSFINQAVSGEVKVKLYFKMGCPQPDSKWAKLSQAYANAW